MRPSSSLDACRTAAAARRQHDDDTAASPFSPDSAEEIYAQLRREPDPASPTGLALAKVKTLLLRFGAPEFEAEQARLLAGGDPHQCSIAGRLVQLLRGGCYELHSIVGTTLDADGALWLVLSNRMMVRSDVCSGEPVGIDEVEQWRLHNKV